MATTGSSTNPYQFAATSGYRDDGDAGLLHVGARYYDPQVGRFLTRDTYLDQHPYLYCDHDPVNHVDPSGHQAVGVLVRGGAKLIPGVREVSIVIGLWELWQWWRSHPTPPPMPDVSFAKGGKKRVRDTGLQDLPLEEIQRRLADPNITPEEKRRLQREEKARGGRNRRKREEQ